MRVWALFCLGACVGACFRVWGVCVRVRVYVGP